MKPTDPLCGMFEHRGQTVQLQLGSWPALGPLAAALRTRVFVEEQNIAPELEWDEDDASALHCVAIDRQGQALATGRLLQHAPGVARIGRMAVTAALRGTGLGQRVLHALMEAARARGDTRVLLHAQCSVEGFYQRSGYVAQGPVFEEAGIAHIEMVRGL